MNQTAVERTKKENKLTLTGTNVELLKMLVRSHKNRTTTAAVGTNNGDCVEVNFFLKLFRRKYRIQFGENVEKKNWNVGGFVCEETIQDKMKISTQNTDHAQKQFQLCCCVRKPQNLVGRIN